LDMACRKVLVSHPLRFQPCLVPDMIVRTDHSAYSHQPGYSSYDPYGSTNPYAAAGVGRPPGDSLYITAQNTPTQTPAPPMPTIYPHTPTPPVPQPQPQPQPQESYNPFSQHPQSPTQYTAPDQGHVLAPWQAGQAQRQPTMPMPTPTPAQPPQQNTGVPNEAPPGYDYGVPGGYQ